jgi:hypothetical protein
MTERGTTKFQKMMEKPPRKIKFSRKKGFLVASAGRTITMAQTRCLMNEFP